MKPKAYTDEQIEQIRQQYATGLYSYPKLAKIYFVSKETMKAYCKGVRKPRKAEL